METFTEDQEAYISLVEEVKKTLPDAYSSVKNLDIVDIESLLKSLYFFLGTHYINKGSSNIYYGNFILQDKSSRVYKLNSSEIAMNVVKITNDERKELITNIFKSMMTYIPSLQLSIKPNYDYLKNPKLIEFTGNFLRHLEINRNLLLTGPPHANEHTINKEKASQWVSKQKTGERQRLAQILLDNLRYISHKELLEALQTCVEKAKAQLKEGPVIFIVGSPSKSNYYISLLFAHFWLKQGLPIHAVTTNLIHIDSVSIGGNFLDIDDMSYSGSQTDDSLLRTYVIYLNKFRKVVKENLEHNPEYAGTYMFLPRHIVEKTLDNIGFQYIVVRAFMSDISFDRLTKDNSPKMPFQICTSEIIPYLPGVETSDKKKLEALFNNEGDVSSTVYFDHKVADPLSTFLYAITFGVVPEKNIVKVNNWNQKNYGPYVNDIEGDGVEFFPFINHCSKDGRKSFPTNRKSMMYDAPQSFRCPPAWYKYIDYEKGIYPKIKQKAAPVAAAPVAAAPVAAAPVAAAPVIPPKLSRLQRLTQWLSRKKGGRKQIKKEKLKSKRKTRKSSK